MQTKIQIQTNSSQHNINSSKTLAHTLHIEKSRYSQASRVKRTCSTETEYTKHSYALEKANKVIKEIEKAAAKEKKILS